MNKFLGGVAALFLVGCGAKKEVAVDETQPATTLKAERDHIDRNATAADLPPAAKIGGAEGRSPFEGKRVIDLNAIVKQSLETIQEFDKRAPAIRAAVASAAKPGASAIDKATANDGLAAIDTLYGRAKSALDEMGVAEATVKSSGEYFDEPILAGMVKFTQDVERELREEKASLAAILAGEPAL